MKVHLQRYLNVVNGGNMRLLNTFLLTSIVTISVPCNRVSEKDREDAYRFAQTHYSVNKFIDFYDTLKALVSNQYTNDSIGQLKADTFIVQNMYFGHDVSYFSDSLTPVELENLYGKALYIQGWDDCEPILTDTGYILTDMPYYSDYTYNDSIYYDDSLKIKPYLSRYENGVKVEDAVLGYSPNQLQFLAMLWQSNH